MSCRQVACGGHHTVALLNKLPPLSNDMHLMINHSALSDLTILSEDGTNFSAHRAILSARSPYFYKLFSEQPDLKQISIEADHATIMTLLQFIYTDDTTLSKSIAAKNSIIYKLAKLYELPRLQESCQVINEEIDSTSPPTLSKDIEKILNNPNYFPDFVFLVENKKIFAHK